MAGVTNKEVPIDLSMFNEIFVLYKKYYHPDNTEEYWRAVFADFEAFTLKYNTVLSKDLTYAVITELERKGKGQANV